MNLKRGFSGENFFSCFHQFPQLISRSLLRSLQHLFSHVLLSPRPLPPPIKAKWTPCEPLASYCPLSMTPMGPKGGNVVLILTDTAQSQGKCVHSGWKDLFFFLMVVFCFFLLVFAVDFLAKYCIFSQETLAEYRKAFEDVRKMTLKNLHRAS